MFRWPKKNEDGGAVVEFALCTLVLVPTLLYAVFLYELSRAKIKTNEVSRYMVWEMTVLGLSDWQNGNHAGRFSSVKGQIMGEMVDRYGDGDLDGATCTGCAEPQVPVKGWKANMPITMTIALQDKDLVDSKADIFQIGGVDAASKGIDKIFEYFNFNTNGKPMGKMSIKCTNKFLGRFMLPGFNDQMLSATDFVVSSEQSIVADQWDLKDGAGVRQSSQYDCSADYCKQVTRMTFFGLRSKLDGFNKVMGPADKIMGSIGFHIPFEATVASLPLDGGDSSHQLEVADPPHGKHKPVRKHYTNVYKDTYVAKNSEYYKTYQKLGPYYMGCKQELRQDQGVKPASRACTYK